LDIISQAKPLNAVPSALLDVVAKQQRIAQCSMNTDAFGLGWEDQERRNFGGTWLFTGVTLGQKTQARLWIGCGAEVGIWGGAGDTTLGRNGQILLCLWK
jgi:hypothetical protein